MISSSLPIETKRILLAEDNPVIRQIVAQQLKKLGVQVDAVTNGREAVAAVEADSAGSYTLILMDCQMPELNGLEATRAIRSLQSDTHHTPIIAVTGGEEDQDRESCIEAGMDDCLTKPVSFEQLRGVLLHWSPIGSKFA